MSPAQPWKSCASAPALSEVEWAVSSVPNEAGLLAPVASKPTQPTNQLSQHAQPAPTQAQNNLTADTTTRDSTSQQGPNSHSYYFDSRPIPAVRYNPAEPPSPEGSCTTREIDLASAISEIKQARDEAEDGKSPFFIIAGAGISAPIVPLASEITQECKQEATKHNRAGEPPANSSLDAYSYWFGKAFPQRSQRQRYFKKLIAARPISHANFRLAHLLSEKRLATLVVTPNFDDFLARALTLFGQSYIVCDHANTVERIDPESSEIQIVHVHGTYWFYDGCNLRGEIEARTEDSRDRAVTMQSLLDNIFLRHSALVVGYAGWDGDVIMAALKRRLLNPLPNNLYWFCFRRSSLEPLRALLKDYPDVCLVLPPAPPVKSVAQPAGEAKPASGTIESEPTLTAQSVLDSLVENFTEESPALTLDPLGFFADQLTKSFPQDSLEKSSEDIYTLRDVIRRVERAREGEKKPTPIEGDIEKVRDAIRRAAYAEALQATSLLVVEKLSEDQREALIEPVASAAFGIADNPQRSEDESRSALNGCNLVLRLADATRTADSIRAQQNVARALLVKAFLLDSRKLYTEALQACEQLLQRFGEAQDPLLRERVAKALRNKGLVLIRLRRDGEAMQTVDQMLQRFGDSTEPVIREQVAVALSNKGFRLGELNRVEEAIQTYDEVLRRFGDATEPVVREQVATDLLNKGACLSKLNRSEEEIHIYDEVVRRFGAATEPVAREQVAKALVNKALALDLNRGEETIQTYDEVLHRFGAATEPVLREQVATALLYKGQTLNALKRPQEARLSFQEVLKRFSDSPDGAIQQLVKKAKAELKSLDEANL
jgi:tetratricopeptide (TPR) repeat protein